MTRRTGSGPAGRNGIAPGLAVAALAVAMLLPPAPAEAGWLGRGLGVAGAARSLKRNLGEAVDLLDDTLGAAIQGDFEEVERLSGELRAVPGKIITDAYPALGIGAAALKAADAAGDRLKAARRRVGRFVGEAVADARMALETGKYEIEAGVLDPKKPLPAVTLSGPAGTKHRTPSGSGAVSAPDPWGQDPEEDEKAATGGADPWGQESKEEETAAGDVDPPGEDGRAGREGGDEAIDRLQGEYAAALDRFLSAEEGSSDYESTLSALLEREKELLAGVAGPEEQELTPDERRRVQACLAEREFDPGAADGIFGPRTRTAIRAWQASQGREESGRLEPSSARELLEECEVALAEAETAAELSVEESNAGTETAKVSAERTFEPKCAAIFDGKPADAQQELFDKTDICYIEFADRSGCHLVVGNSVKSSTHFFIRTSLGYRVNFISTHIIDWVWWWREYLGEKLEIPRPRWSGECSEGVPDGEGTVSISHERPTTHGQWKRKRDWTGEFVDGVPQGDWTFSEISESTSIDGSGRTQHNSSRFSMMNGELHGEYSRIDRYTNYMPSRNFEASGCYANSARFVNGEYQRGSSRSEPCDTPGT